MKWVLLSICCLLILILLVRVIVRLIRVNGLVSTLFLLGALVCYCLQFYYLMPVMHGIVSAMVSSYPYEDRGTEVITLKLFMPSFVLVGMLIASGIARFIRNRAISTNQGTDLDNSMFDNFIKDEEEMRGRDEY